MGSTGEWILRSKNVYEANNNAAYMPLAGSLYSGIILALLLLMFFVGIYACFMSFPIPDEEDGEKEDRKMVSFIFMDPKFLVLLNSTIVLTAAFGISNSFLHCICSQCTPPAVLCVLYALFAVATCWVDLGICALVLPLWKRSRCVQYSRIPNACLVMFLERLILF